MGRSEHRTWSKRNRLLRAGGVELNGVMVAGEGAYGPHFFLRVDTTQLDGVSDAADGQHVSRDAVVDVVRVGEVHDVLKGLAQDELQLFVHGGFLPEISLAVLHPLKVRSGDAAGVGENVWNDKDFFVGQDFIGGGGGGTVGAFANDFGLDAG